MSKAAVQKRILRILKKAGNLRRHGDVERYIKEKGKAYLIQNRM